jgi:hypothetical protein
MSAYISKIRLGASLAPDFVNSGTHFTLMTPAERQAQLLAAADALGLSSDAVLEVAAAMAETERVSPRANGHGAAVYP